MSPLKLDLDVCDRKSKIGSMRRICSLEDGRSHTVRNVGGPLVTPCKEQGLPSYNSKELNSINNKNELASGFFPSACR